MPKGSMQKQKLLYLQKILLEKTDERHGLTIAEIITELGRYGISSERKSFMTTSEFWSSSVLMYAVQNQIQHVITSEAANLKCPS